MISPYPVPMVFQSTLPRGERRYFRGWSGVAMKFQSTLPRGERLRGGRESPCRREFQSTLPRGERPPQTPAIKSCTVSIHAPARGATSETRPSSRRNTFQSTLPRGERPGVLRVGEMPASVSIHAPARGATATPAKLRQPERVSIHAPARGATITLEQARRMQRVSIHAPARGATHRGRDHGDHELRFNPRSRAGSDEATVLVGVGEEVSIHAPARGATTTSQHRKHRNRFQSTLPRGERPSEEALSIRGITFQSTLPRGERLTLGNDMEVAYVSIHAPARGATPRSPSSRDHP